MHLPGLLLSVPRLHGRPLLSQASAGDPKHSQASLVQSLVGLQLLAPGAGVHKALFDSLQASLFPQSCGSLVIKSCYPSKSDSLGLPSPLGRSHDWRV